MPIADSLTALIQRVKRAPYLSAERELELFAAGDTDAIVEAHLRIALAYAYRYRGYGHLTEELYAVGCVGLAKAVQKFDPTRGARFATLCQWLVRAEVQQYVMQNHSLVKIGTTAAQKSCYFGLTRARREIPNFENLNQDQQNAALADRLNVRVEDVVMMVRRMTRDVSLNVQVSDDDETHAEWLDFLEDPNAVNPEDAVADRDEEEHTSARLQAALDSLPPRERHVAIARANGITLQVLSQELGCSRERCRQLMVKAHERIKWHLEHGSPKPKMSGKGRKKKATPKRTLRWLPVKDYPLPVPRASRQAAG